MTSVLFKKSPLTLEVGSVFFALKITNILDKLKVQWYRNTTNTTEIFFPPTKAHRLSGGVVQQCHC